MSRTIPAAITSAIAGAVTKPGVLLEITFPSPGAPFRASSRGTVVWNGNVFVPYGMEFQGFGSDASQSSSSGSITFADVTNALGTLVLSYGVADVPVSLWLFYNDPVAPNYVLATGDALAQFVGVGNDASLDVSTGRVSISCAPAGGRSMYGPRTYITRENGFKELPVPGTVIAWGDERFTLEADNG